MGQLNKLDRNILAGYCSAFALWQQAQEVLHQQGTVYFTPKGKLEIRPEVEIAKTTGEMMQGFAEELGLTPTSRARMNLPKENKEIDPMEEILREVEMERRK
jgi:P27 family predicted phage terminase small subunit